MCVTSAAEVPEPGMAYFLQMMLDDNMGLVDMTRGQTDVGRQLYGRPNPGLGLASG